ncbi:MAG: hypothetical protein ABW076_08575 [Candidatus Thiodiazotropha sp.]
MQYMPTQKRLSSEQKRLLECFNRLSPQDRDTLQAFADFLAARESTDDDATGETGPLKPKPIDRPRDESVVKAIKRLSERYFMLQREKLLDETSSLMMTHIMQGRPAPEVIDDLEALFERHYQEYLKQA